MPSHSALAAWRLESDSAQTAAMLPRKIVAQGEATEKEAAQVGSQILAPWRMGVCLGVQRGTVNERLAGCIWRLQTRGLPVGRGLAWLDALLGVVLACKFDVMCACLVWQCPLGLTDRNKELARGPCSVHAAVYTPLLLAIHVYIHIYIYTCCFAFSARGLLVRA